MHCLRHYTCRSLLAVLSLIMVVRPQARAKPLSGPIGSPVSPREVEAVVKANNNVTQKGPRYPMAAERCGLHLCCWGWGRARANGSG
jgi:hypothetical protein